MAANAQEPLLQLAVGRKPPQLYDAIDPAVHHDGDVFGNDRRNADILLDDEDRHVAFLAKTNEHFLDLRHDHRREALGRLVHD